MTGESLIEQIIGSVRVGGISFSIEQLPEAVKGLMHHNVYWRIWSQIERPITEAVTREAFDGVANQVALERGVQ